MWYAISRTNMFQCCTSRWQMEMYYVEGSAHGRREFWHFLVSHLPEKMNHIHVIFIHSQSFVRIIPISICPDNIFLIGILSSRAEKSEHIAQRANRTHESTNWWQRESWTTSISLGRPIYSSPFVRIKTKMSKECEKKCRVEYSVWE